MNVFQLIQKTRTEMEEMGISVMVIDSGMNSPVVLHTKEEVITNSYYVLEYEEGVFPENEIKRFQEISNYIAYFNYQHEGRYVIDQIRIYKNTIKLSFIFKYDINGIRLFHYKLFPILKTHKGIEKKYNEIKEKFLSKA